MNERKTPPGANRVALISESAWDRRFGRDAGIVGRAITLDGTQHSVVGVLPASFYFPNRDAEVWTPFVVEPASTTPGERRVMAFPAIARLKDSVSVSQAEAEGTTIRTYETKARATTPVEATDPTLNAPTAPIAEEPEKLADRTLDELILDFFTHHS